eukprot:1368274-Pleurochrysis_carterae.AAC.1
MLRRLMLICAALVLLFASRLKFRWSGGESSAASSPLRIEPSAQPVALFGPRVGSVRWRGREALHAAACGRERPAEQEGALGCARRLVKRLAALACRKTCTACGQRCRGPREAGC